MLRLRALLLVLIACLLPLQTALACAMQLCHDATQQVVVQDDLADAHCHSHEADVTTATQAGTACEDCGVCHLAGTGFLLTDGERLAVLVGIDVLVPQPLATPRSHITEPSLHPPRNRA